MGVQMADANIKSTTGNANIKRQGHTTNGSFGTDPSFKGKVKRNVRDLKAK